MSPPTNPTDPIATSSDTDRVRAVALDYIEGWYAGDAERMERSLHDDLVKRTPRRGDEPAKADLRTVSKGRMVELTSRGGGSDVADPAIEVVVDDVSDDIACARTVCVEFVDYMQLVKTPDGWKIANVLFRNAG
jgi:Putative lumazine-binding